MDPRMDKLRQFIEEHCLIRKEGIKLASGRTSNFYVDCRVALMDPRSLPLIAELVLDSLMDLPERPRAVGGTVVGAVPITAAVVQLSALRDCPLTGFMVRREIKAHGTQKKIENVPAPGTRVAILEDVVTSGGSTIGAIDASEEAGLEIVSVVPIVDRGEGGEEAIRTRLPRAVYAPLLRSRDFGTR